MYVNCFLNINMTDILITFLYIMCKNTNKNGEFLLQLPKLCYSLRKLRVVHR